MVGAVSVVRVYGNGVKRCSVNSQTKRKMQKVKVARIVVVLGASGELAVVLGVVGELTVGLDAVGGTAAVLDAVGEPAVVFDVVLSRSTWPCARRTFRSRDFSRRANRLRSCSVRSLCC